MPSASFVPKKSTRASLSQRAPPVPDFNEAIAKKADAESIERHMANFFADLNSNKVDLITTGNISIGTNNQITPGQQQQQQQQGIIGTSSKPLVSDSTTIASSPAADSTAKKPFDKSKFDKIGQMLASKKQEVQASKTDLNDKLKSLFQKNGLTASSSASATVTSNSSQPSAGAAAAPSNSLSPQLSKKTTNTSATTTSFTSSPASAGAGGTLSTKDTINLQPVLNKKEEYDPARPNDYEALKRAQQKKREDMDKIREKKQLAQEEQDNSNKMDEEQQHQDNDGDGQDESDYFTPSLGLGAAKAGLGSSSSTSTKQQPTQAMEIEKDTGDLYSKTEYETSEEKAYKLMSKQGFKIGQGLGKQSQGIVAPIIAQKISDTSAIITQSSMDLSTILPQQVIIKRYLEQRNLTATKVVCLINLIAPYEIDETLEEEITEECFQYGVVVNLKIYVMAAEDCQDAVRIFVKYDSLDESSNAFTHLDGRIFNGRSVIGYFYSEEDFESNQLANKL